MMCRHVYMLEMALDQAVRQGAATTPPPLTIRALELGEGSCCLLGCLLYRLELGLLGATPDHCLVPINRNNGDILHSGVAGTFVNRGVQMQ